VQLKAATGGARLEVTLSAPDDAAIPALARLVEGRINVSDDGRRLDAAIRTASGLATAVVRALDESGVLVDDVAVRPPSLDDVFFALTGRPVLDEAVQDEPARELEEVSA
jgi:ABC-2 type transport system ATP-binding protein